MSFDLSQLFATVSHFLSPAEVTAGIAATRNAVSNFREGNLNPGYLETGATAINITKLGLAFIEFAGKEIPGLGTSASLASLAINIQKAQFDIDKDGAISTSTRLSIAADITSLLSNEAIIAAVGIGAAAGATAATPVVILASGLMLLGTGLTYGAVATDGKGQVDLGSWNWIQNSVQGMHDALGVSLQSIFETVGGLCGTGTAIPPSAVLSTASPDQWTALALDEATVVVTTTRVEEPIDLGTTTRDSTTFFTFNDAHSVVIVAGGTLSDIWWAQRNSTNGFANDKEYYAAIMVCNPVITNPNNVATGQMIYLPQKLADGSITYHYANGASINNNVVTNEYFMSIPDGMGGTAIYSRIADEFGYTVRQVQQDSNGQTTYEATGYLNNLNSTISWSETVQRSDTNADGLLDQTITITTPNENIIDTVIVSDQPNQPESHTILINGDEYDGLDTFQLSTVESRVGQMLDGGNEIKAYWDGLTRWTSDLLLVNPSTYLPTPAPYDPGSFWLDPIGAFYDSQSTAYDNAASIAAHTPTVLDNQNHSLTSAQLTALDTNHDGQLSSSETTNLKLWRDLNENGLLESGELGSVDRVLKQDEYALLSRNAPGTAAPTEISNATLVQPSRTTVGTVTQPGKTNLVQAVPASNYRTLRDTDNIFYVSGGGYITWTASQVKINYSNQSYLIGTDGNDSFDSNYYAAYPQYFNSSLLTNFLGGGGDDVVGGSTRNDNIWGGTGNDVLYGYAGDDKMYGEAGIDELQGQDGNDYLDGGTEADKLFGGVGNDVLNGGDGNDVLMGFTPSNDPKQTLNAGETDNDYLYGGNGDDYLNGGLGTDYLDGGLNNDALLGGMGDDTLFGGDGIDELQGNEGNDRLMGETGDDNLFGQVGNDTLWGGDGNDLLMGFTANNELKQTLNAGETDDDVLYGEAGNDTLAGGLGNDILDGGIGADLVDGGAGNDVLLGQAGDDQLQGGDGQDTLDGGADNDILMGDGGDDLLFGGTGNDELQGNDGSDRLLGEAGDDRMFGQVGNDILWGGDGNDVLVGFTASNELKQTLSAGETDDDTLYGEGGNDNLFGSYGNDVLDGGTGADLLVGEAGDDKLFGGADSDELQGGDGNDQLAGGDGDDKLFGQVGNDTLWGGAGNDLLMGFTGDNELKQTLNAGETDDDTLVGGAGSDILIGGLGQDALYGGTGRDELQGGAGNDVLYGEEDNDNLFGQVGNDVLYGGDGDDFLQGFTANNELKQRLSAGETDDDFLYGGAGKDTLLGGVGNDYLDGGAGADVMVGGAGDDTYVVNSVNDVIYEQAGEGYDTVVASTNYLLNANVEELRLVESFAVHGTGNALDNRIVGNSSDNILDGVTGADTMIGGAGNDTYYVDNAGDQVVENAGEGSDTVQSSIGYTLGGNVENLILLDFSKPEKGLVDGQQVLVYGYPKRNELDYMQGDAVQNYLGTCALTSIANLLTQTGRPTTESQVVNLAINNNWAVSNPNLPAYLLGGSNITDQRNILNSYQIRNDVIYGYNEAGIANLARSGRGVIIGVNAGALWNDWVYAGNGGVNHAITLTGAVYKADDGSLAGFYVADSGRGMVSDMTRFVDIATFRQAANVANAYSIYTIEPVKFWEEDIDGTGNDLNNTLIGNRGSNTLRGLAGDDVLQGDAGNDVLEGGAGSDTLAGGVGDDEYRFGIGDGHDVIQGADGVDILQFGTGINAGDVVVGSNGNDIVLSLNAQDSVRFTNTGGIAVDKVAFADGTIWHATADGSGFNASLTGDLSIVGQSRQGQTLTVLNTLQDPDGLGAFSYQWQSSADGLNWSDVSGATTDSLTLGQDQVGQLVRVHLSYTDGRGNAEQITTRASAAVANVNDVPTGTVAINGSAIQNQTLNASNTLADADGLGTMAYQWETSADGVNWNAINGATAGSFTLTEAQVGQQVRVLTSYVDGYGTVESMISTPTQVIANVNDTPSGSVTISGTAEQNQTLLATHTLADVDGLGPIDYQWQIKNDNTWWDIQGASGNTFTLTEAQVGHEVRVMARYVDGHNAIEMVASTATTTVANVNDVPVGAVTIAGTATQNQILTASNSLTDADGLGVVGYQWQSSADGTNWNSIAGATNASFNLTEAQVGQQIRVMASYIDGHGTTESVLSSATGPIANVNDAPAGTVTINGTAAQNQMLSVSNTLSDIDGMGPASYQWQASTDGLNWNAISGATGASLAVTEAQVGKQLRVAASYTDGHGTSELVLSSATAAVANVNDAPTGAVLISGTASQNQNLTASNTLADADGLGAVGYQWQSSVDGLAWSAISGATAASFTLTEAQVGRQVRVMASYTDGHGTLESVASGATAAVANVNDAPTGLVSVSGAATQNQTLTASNTLADADGLGTIAYQWQSSSDGTSWNAINGATTASLTLTESQVGKQIRVVASYVDGHGANEVVASTATAAVANVNDAPTGNVTIAGTATQYQTLTAANTLADVDGLGVIGYRWQSSSDGSLWNDIAGATGNSFTLAEAQVGKQIRVVASYTDGHGTPESIASSATMIVANVNDAPVSAIPLSNQSTTEGAVFTATIPLGSFTDPDIGDTLSYSAKLSSGASLPTWLTFNSATRTFSGTAGTADLGSLQVVVTATDGSGLSATATFQLDVLAHAPVSLTGTAGNDVLTGFSGADTLNGGAGADQLIGKGGNDTYIVDNTGDVVVENANEGIDIVQASVTYTLAANIENLTLTGTSAINGTGNGLDNTLTGNSGANTLTGGAGNDVLNGGAGIDTMVGGTGDDIYYVDNTKDVITENANEGVDVVNSSVTLTMANNAEALILTGTSAINGTGNTLNNLVRGNAAVNTLNGGSGNDILEGGDGNDVLTDIAGTALFNGGAGSDSLTGGTSAEIFLGGLGNDTLTTAAGNDIILFNKGDGQDTFASGGTGNDTISLGGGIRYADLTFSKVSSDLVLKIGATDQITFKSWYAAKPSKPVANLQMIAEAMSDYAPGGGDPLRDQKVENFNFAGLARAFDAALAANPSLTSWALTNALGSYQLTGSDSAAIGGDLAYQYGKTGTLAGIGLTPALNVLSDSALGSSAQTLSTLSSLQTGSVRLS